jgi:pimeloyl-ACP methyl ester carboxylesterase
LKIVFKDPTFSSLLLRTIAETYYRGADIGECLSTAYRIKEGEFESWYEEWLNTAKRVHSYADDCTAKGHTISARDAYLRASNYYRTAEFLLVEPADPRSQTTIDLSKDCFRKAASTFPIVVVPVEIPYEGTLLPGYFYHATKELANDNEKQLGKNKDTNSQEENNGEKSGYEGSVTDTSVNPTLLVHGGFDSTLEELYFFAAAPALERGYNCLTFEGPGQGNVIRKQKLPFRHDWEKVVTPALELMLSEREFNVDPKHIALMGISMGGYLAARAVAFEPRISAVILYDGVYDGYDAIASGFPAPLLEAVEKGNSEFVNKTLTELMESDPNIKFNMKHGMWTMGATSPYELITGAKKYSVKEILKNIKCPTLVLEGEKDDSFPDQPKKVYDGLVSLKPPQKKHIVFTVEEGAEEHCQSGASAITNQRIFDWLDETFKIKARE